MLVIASLCSLTALAQNEHNLVPNPSFESLDGKIKGAGSIEVAAPWQSMTLNPVDLFSTEAKSSDYAAPENKFGKEEARTGSNYAGIVFFGYRGRTPRTYLGVELTRALEAGKEYCLKFHVSLSDMSKYAVNNLGMYFSKEEISEKKEGNLLYEPHMMSVVNNAYEKQFLWTAICGNYVADGGEKYLIIGNFKTDEETQQETIRLSREFSGRQNYDAYYFIDDVSVIPTDKLSKKDCACDKIAGGQMEVEFKKFGTDESKKEEATKTYLINSDGTKAGSPPIEKKEGAEAVEEAETVEEGGTVYKKFGSGNEEETEEVEETFNPEKVNVYFDAKAIEPKASEHDKLGQLADYLQENPTKKMVIEGHADPSESSVKFLGKRRAFMIQKKLLDMGITEAQVSYVGKETGEPASKSDAAKNQRVTFSIK